MLFYVLLFVLTYCCPTPFPYHMTFVSFKNNTTGSTSGDGTVYHSGHLSSSPVLWALCCSMFSVLCSDL